MTMYGGMGGSTRRVRLRDRAAERLLEMILSGGLAAGERLPPERELVERLGVSRTVVREALNLLEARGVVSIEHGRGAVVSGGNPGAVREALSALLRVRSRSLLELQEIRRILEVEVAGLAAERAGPEEVRAMREQLERMRAQIDAPEGYVDADVEFHAQLARATGNGVLLTMLEPVVELLRDSRKVSASLPGAALRALEEHERILRCVERGDARGAREEMRAHLEHTSRDIQEALEEGLLTDGRASQRGKG
jgi:GntR family transcriptional repressor for pyruvate dehydrogenase complex